ncbi:hypothetical protein LINPERHAP2_LOCUS14246 [Linum perenne]
MGGGLIRNDFGHCFYAFSLNLGVCSITQTEIQTTLFNLAYIWLGTTLIGRWHFKLYPLWLFRSRPIVARYPISSLLRSSNSAS